MISGQVIVLGLHIGEGPETVIKVTFNMKSWLCSMYKLYILVHVLFLNAVYSCTCAILECCIFLYMCYS